MCTHSSFTCTTNAIAAMNNSTNGTVRKLVNRVSGVLGAITKGGTPKTKRPVKSVEEWLAPVQEPYRKALLSMYDGQPQQGSDGNMHTIDTLTRITPKQGMWMHNVALAHKPAAILEVGMAYGFSSLYFLAALERNGSGTLTSIDPFQHDAWKGIGATHAMAHAPQRAEGPAFRLLCDRSDRAIVDLLRKGERFDLIFIDGNHRFDDVLVDFYLCDQVCTVGGHIILDDMWMHSIQSVAAFIRTNRDNFQEVESRVRNTTMFRKIKEDDRSWKHFNTFPVAVSSNVDG